MKIVTALLALNLLLTGFSIYVDLQTSAALMGDRGLVIRNPFFDRYEQEVLFKIGREVGSVKGYTDAMLRASEAEDALNQSEIQRELKRLQNRTR